MLTARHLALTTIVLMLPCSIAFGQFQASPLASFENPRNGVQRFTGGREVAFSDNGEKMIVAFYGSAVQLFDLKMMVPIGEPIGTAGDGEVGFVNRDIAYTADWNSMRLWDTQTGKQVGDAIRHELREDTIIHPAISPKGTMIASRATMQSVQRFDVATSKPMGRQLEYSHDVDSIRFSADGEFLFVRAGGSLHVMDAKTGEDVLREMKSGWIYKHFPQQQILVTTEQADSGSDQLVMRSTDQKGLPVVQRSDLPGRLKRIVELADNRVMLQVSQEDYTPAIFVLSLDEPENVVEVETSVDRAFSIVVTEDMRYWICSNIRNISCQEFGESKPAWQRQVPPSGSNLKLYPFDSEHFIVLDKDENLSVHRVADGNQVWTQKNVKRFGRFKNKIALCNDEGVEVWELN